MKTKIVVLCVAMLLLLAGCSGKGQSEEILDASHETFYYKGTEDVKCIAVDENGLLYTAKFVIPDQGSSQIMPYQELCIYDLEGNCVNREEVILGSSSVQAMWIEKDALYCIGKKRTQENVSIATLYKVDILNWEVTEVVSLDGFNLISNIAYCDGYLYFLGQYDQMKSQNYFLHPDVIEYNYFGEQIGRVCVETEEPYLEIMHIDFPISIYTTSENTLMIYHYTEENGFGFLEFNPTEMTFAEAGWKNTSTSLQELGGCGEGYLFWKDTYLYYGTIDGMEAQVAPERVDIRIPAVYQKGFAFYIDYAKGGIVERICVEDIVKENKTIHMLMHDDIMDLPYGCGYRMEKEVFASEEFALKVLAQDKDFDLYVLSSRDKSSYNLKENGAFYPLNEVEYVQEYLNACFPYIKELATNEAGDVWMVPIGLAIPGLVYNKEYCAQKEIDFDQMNFAEFFDFTAKIKQGEQSEQIAISFLVLKEDLFGQYLKLQDTFDTVMFRNYLEQYRTIYKEKTQSWGLVIDAYDKILAGERPDFYYMYEVYQYSLSLLANELGESDDIGIVGVPGMEEGIGNLGTITFLAVNPQSTNLEETLNYISSFAKYMLTKQNSFLLTDESTYTDTPFIKEWYQLYAEGIIRFNMDLEVYEETFLEYLNGEIELEAAIAEMERRRKIYVGE